VPKKKAKLPLSKTHPELAKEADGWDPTEVTRGSREKLKWICSYGHRWEAIVRRRTEGSGLCPQCSRLPIIGVGDLGTLYPEIARDAYGWDPKECKPFSAIKRKWRCPEGHIWICTSAHRITDGTNCTICSGRNLNVGVNDLKTTHPLISAMANGWDTESVKAGSSLSMEWKGSCGHIWKARIAEVSRGSGCPICSGHKILTSFNDIQSTHPKLAKEAYGWDPSRFGRGSNVKRKWKCSKGHIWETSIKNRTVSGSGCPVCSGREVLKTYNDLNTTHPGIAKEADGWDPSQFSKGSGVKKKWKCSKGHTWSAVIASRTSGGRKKLGNNCPTCSGKKILAGFNDLGTTHPNLAKEAYGWDPRKKTKGFKGKLEWRCSVGHIYTARMTDRTLHKSNCSYCSNQKVLTGFNDLATTHPILAKQIIGLNPKKLIAGSNKKVKWKCSEGHNWIASIHSRSSQSMQRGCPTCAPSGFDPNEKGYLYFLSHSKWQMLQVGITNYPEKRIKSHRKLGWKLVEIRGPMDGHLTQQWETAILRMLKAKGTDLSNSKIAGKFDGYSEAWSKSTFEVKSIKELMRLTEEYEENKSKF
jgi:hypothetical protein